MSEQLHKTIHVVHATTGAPENVESWPVVAYEDEELARRHARAATLEAAEMLATDPLELADNAPAFQWDAKLADVQQPGTTYEVKSVALRDTLPADDDESEAAETGLIRTLKLAGSPVVEVSMVVTCRVVLDNHRNTIGQLRHNLHLAEVGARDFMAQYVRPALDPIFDDLIRARFEAAVMSKVTIEIADEATRATVAAIGETRQ